MSLGSELGDTELVLVRHAPVAVSGCLFGSTDVAANVPADEKLVALRSYLLSARFRFCSPALRCRQTASAIWEADNTSLEVPELWEQSFGEWEGKPFVDIPDIGDISGEALVSFCAPGGESFADLCDRASPALRDLFERGAGPVVGVVHAGIVRACLAMALGDRAAALRFDVDCLSVSRFATSSDGGLVIKSVNERLR